MQLATEGVRARSSKKMLWTGRVMSGFVVLFLLFDCIIKIMRLPMAVEGTVQLGFPATVVAGIGFVLLVSVVLYAIPNTSVLGAILLTGYLGGAVAVQVRVGNPIFGFTLFPTYVGVLLWGGLYLRDSRLRELVPLRTLEKE